MGQTLERMREPEFIEGEVDLRINMYRSHNENADFIQHNIADTETAEKVPVNNINCRQTADKVPINNIDRRQTADKVPINEQEKVIYKFVIENNSITTTQVMGLLSVKQRRAREILAKMVKKKWLKKEGAYRSTIYVINTGTRME